MPASQYKIVLIGTANVGKTSILKRLKEGPSFDINSIPHTINMSIYSIAYMPPNAPSIILNYWDTAGQERFESLGPMYYRDSNAAVAVFDVSELQTFEKAKHYIENFLSNSGSDSSVIVVANKIDLVPSEQLSETLEEIETWCKGKSYPLFLASALKGTGLQEIHNYLGKKFNQDNYAGVEVKESKAEGLAQVPEPNDQKKKGCCN
ncbi:small GTP-binding protein [Histomonas meleagridis]|uniref:small GTP-binding protein n=1 Tax=Histomonas meleagridis TaxID=135588 RepID=UPI00355A3B14|nr:small GTP-binding protein [Histomonas meleagridis]KAH0800096.1 small GTP-binding protein [Histomonas meleagridis]